MSVNRSLLAIAGLLTVMLLAGPIIRGAVLPPNFSDALVAAIPAPTGIAFTPDNRILVTSQAGRLRVVRDGTLRATPALDLASRLCTDSERGLLGVAVDPNFAVNGHIYLFYTFRKHGVCERNTALSPVNRVSRFTLGTNDLVNSSTEVVLVDNMPSPNGNHNGGDVHIGEDGHLYISVGDGGCDYARNSGCAGSNDAARDQHVLTGKVLRITTAGGIPGDNPFQGSDSSRCNVTGSTTAGRKCRETYAWGLRNPFRMAFDRNAGASRFFINDVGQNAWEEINDGISGADYGWNVREGMCANGSTTNCGAPPAGMTNPIHAYGRSIGASITGGAFVPDGLWPAEFEGTYLFADYVAGTIFRLSRQTNGSYVRSTFVTDLGSSSAVALAFGPRGSSQALYYTTYAGGGQVRVITFTGSLNRPPVAAASASPASGPAPLAVSLSAAGSTDPDGDTLTYSWNFGDGSPAASGATVSHTYNTTGTYTATVTANDGRGGTDTATARIDVGNTAPSVTMTAPAAGLLFRVGQTLTLTGSATDAQDGTLPASRLTWTVTQHHASHTHPYLQPTAGNNLTITAPAPEDLAATTNSFLTVRLTATDSSGLSTTITRQVRPRLVNVTFNTSPSGLRVTANGVSFTGPSTFTSWDGYALNVDAPAQTNGSGQAYRFSSWSDGGAAQHTIVTPAAAASYTATFVPAAGGINGLRGEYFDTETLTGTPLVRTDPNVNFNWSSGSPNPAIAPDTFSARWTGFVEPAFSQTYTFYTQSDDGVRLWIDGAPVIDNWTAHSSTENSATVALTAGRRHAIRLEYFERTGGAEIRLSWSSASQPKQIIPTARLFTSGSTATPVRINFQPAGAPVPAGYLADSGAVFAARGNGQSYGWNANNSASSRDRNASNSLDQRYDTLLHLQKNGTFTWELAVASGTYNVRIVAGDASFFDSTFRIAAEGTLVVNGTPTSATRWIEGTAAVTVTDGRLTVSGASGAANNKICFVEVTRR